MNFELIVVLGCLFAIFVIWSYFVLTKKSGTSNEILEKLKLKSIKDDVIDRTILGTLIKEAIITGDWSP